MSSFPVLFDHQIRGGSILPYSIDFSALGDGVLPAPWAGSTWAISSSVAVNTPTLGSNALTDPGLEATYTAGLCDTLTGSGSVTVAESADVHGGSKAQSFKADGAGAYLRFAYQAGIAGQWWQSSVWGKRTDGATGNCLWNMYSANNMPSANQGIEIIDAAYTQKKVSYLTTDTANKFRRILGNDTANTVLIDDCSDAPVTEASIYTMLSSPTAADVVVKIKPAAFVDGTLFGMLLRADAATSMTNFIMVLYRSFPTAASLGAVYVIKRIGATYTSVLAETLVNPIVADSYLEVRASGSTVQVFYNGAQKGADLTIADAELVSNKYVGMFSVGGNQIKDFFVAAN